MASPSRRAPECGLYVSHRSAARWTASRSWGSAAHFIGFGVLHWPVTSLICNPKVTEILRTPVVGSLSRWLAILHQSVLPGAWVLWHGLSAGLSQFPGPASSAPKLARICHTHSFAAYRKKGSHWPESPSHVSCPLEQASAGFIGLDWFWRGLWSRNFSNLRSIPDSSCDWREAGSNALECSHYRSWLTARPSGQAASENLLCERSPHSHLFESN